MDFLIVGLGNPGQKYHNTRHNIGFLLVDFLSNRWNCANPTDKFHSVFCQGRVAGHKVAFLKPQTFMNLSGKAVAEYMRFYKINVENVIVIHDDIDMAPGRVKLVRGGGTGGHNGIKSINSCTGKIDYFRLKIGVGRPGQHDIHPDIPVEKYVLAPFSSEQQDILDSRLDEIEKGLVLFMDESPVAATNILNSLK